MDKEKWQSMIDDAYKDGYIAALEDFYDLIEKGLPTDIKLSIVRYVRESLRENLENI